MIKESLKAKVSLLALNGIWPRPEFIALIHSLRAKRDLLISAPSNLLFLLLLCVSWALSEPAKSQTISLPLFLPFSSHTYIIQIACDLEDVSLCIVEWVVLWLNANFIFSNMWSEDSIFSSCKFYIMTLLLLPSRISTFYLSFNKS